MRASRHHVFSFVIIILAACEVMTSPVTMSQLPLVAAENQARENGHDNQGRVVLRRLNRTEYQNTIHDLLGIDLELKELLPPDGAAAGFDNVGEALHVSSYQMERYLEVADKALSVAIANLPQPTRNQKRYTLKDERLVKTTTESVYLTRDDSVVMFSSSPWNAITVGQFYPPDRGRYRVRIAAYGHQSAGKPVTFRIDAGPMLMGTKNHLVDYFDAEADKPTLIEFSDHFEARHHFRISPYGLAGAQVVTKAGADKYDGPGLGIEWVEVDGPLHDTWPPESHRRLFEEMEQGPAPIYNFSKRVEVVSKEPLADANRILHRFARRAFRRPVTDDDLKPYLKLFETKLAEQRSFEQAIRVSLTGILVSPEFLFLRESPGPLDDFALASRLSYFLWSTMPDDELMTLAEKGLLTGKGSAANSASQKDGAGDNGDVERNTNVLRQQVERMLKHPNAEQFVVNFVGQWLGLRDIDFTEPSHLMYPEFDDMLKVSMVRETERFFAEVLKDDLSLTNFVASDFSMLNARLAKHYGIPGVDGFALRKTPLPPESHRGGVLTMASVLKVTANGTSTSPVLRGAWVMDRILGDPPSPPPENVAALEPDIRGATTIREQLAKHRQNEACASCHVEIDPPGFALESFDVIGGWRDRYRTTTWARHVEEVRIDGRKMPYYHGLKVDPSDTLPDGRTFKNVDDFKQLLLVDKDKITRALVTKLLTYATGAAPSRDDKPQVEALVGASRKQNYGFRSLIHNIVASDLFRTK